MIDYLWLKAFHLIAVMSWMAGLLYLPRLFVYHALVEVGSVRSETFHAFTGTQSEVSSRSFGLC